MSEKYKVLDGSRPTFVTMTITGWVDLFIRPRYSTILDESIQYCIHHKGLVVHAYVYMTSHIHLIVSSHGEPLQNIVRDFKKHTSKELIKAIKEPGESRREWLLKKFAFEAKRSGRAKNFKVWQDGFHPVLLDTNEKMDQRVRYTHYNPVVAGFVDHEMNWSHSSYSAYTDENVRLNFDVSPLW